ncbi:hypothetical protein AYO21_09091 [Fonsecaea monophora]|uniref:Uncharacterized protein n=1 Tax=Fonsecaea monophora TaxID=254056 RepID=A0A177EXD2_9EURO|nr:hypothetical protein AYO21_09091 [Fonsecaea monophora]OAG36707.1 hypothetical protein AYO21_09091 [Fonsecaea monophora]
MARLQDNAREHWDWEKSPIRVYTPDPEELKDGLREGDVPEPRPPPPPKCDQLDEIEKAASEGDLCTIQRIFDQLRGTPAGDYWIPRQTSSLFRAVRTGHTAIVEYLLSQGSSPTVNLAKIAVDNNDTAILELFLKYGWDINEQLGWCDPPVLG